MPNLGQTQSFVLAQGFQPLGEAVALVGCDGRARLFAELTADPDRQEVRPQEAYQALISSLQPGWRLRMLQICWPDPLPRRTFYEQAEKWQRNHEGLELLHQGLLLFTQEAPLPFLRRTLLEFVFAGVEGRAWWEGVAKMMENFGVTLRPLPNEEIVTLAQRLFDPALD
ncbi:MAG: hypothetical protein Fur0022_02310 [Anaerolineales bacterium]